MTFHIRLVAMAMTSILWMKCLAENCAVVFLSLITFIFSIIAVSNVRYVSSMCVCVCDAYVQFARYFVSCTVIVLVLEKERTSKMRLQFYVNCMKIKRFRKQSHLPSV